MPWPRNSSPCPRDDAQHSALPRLCQAAQCRRYASLSMLFHCSAGRHQSNPQLRSASPCQAIPLRRHTLPCFASAVPRTASPCRRGSWQSIAEPRVAVPLLSLCRSGRRNTSPCLCSASMCLCQALHVSAIPKHLVAVPQRRIPALCDSSAWLRFALPRPSKALPLRGNAFRCCSTALRI